MGKHRTRHKKFNYAKDRKKAGKRAKKRPTIKCKEIRDNWDVTKSIADNLKDMGLSSDPNKTIGMTKKRKSKGKLHEVEEVSLSDLQKLKSSKSHVAEAMEKISQLPRERRVRLSDPEVRFCIRMIEKYGDDYKAMARDSKNHYQETPKQIQHKIRTFMSIPEQYNAYLAVRNIPTDTDTAENMDTD